MSSTVRLGSRRRGKAVTIAQSISIALSSSARTVVQGSTTTLTVTLTRVGGYTGTVTPSVTGLPSGVTGSWSDSSLTGADTTTVLTLTADIAASLVTADAFTITCSGSGVTDATAAATVTVEAAGSVAPFFEESFTGGVTSNANGFTWSEPFGSRVAITSAEAHSGTHCIAVTFGPTAVNSNGEQGGSVEITGNLGRSLTEGWVEYWCKVSANYTHRINTSASNNNKWMYWWRDYYNYNIDGSLMIASETLPNIVTNPNGGSVLRDAGNSSTYSVITDFQPSRPAMFGGDNGVAGVDEWFRLRHHVRVSSANGVTDGVYQWWVNSTQIKNLTNLDLSNRSSSALPDCVLKTVRFLGSCDSGFTDATTIYLDDIKFYDTDPGW